MPSTVLITAVAVISVWLCFSHRSNSKVKKCLIVLLLLMLAGSNPWFVYHAIKPLEHTYLSSLRAEYDRLTNLANSQIQDQVVSIVVLGSGYTSANGVPAHAKISLNGQGRLVAGVSLYQLLDLGKRVNAQFIVSGYSGQSQPALSYAEIAAQQVQSFKVVDADHIRILGQPKTTAEEAKVMKGLLDGEPFYLVTSALHMPRAMALMQAQGLTPIAWPTAFNSLEKRSIWKAPKASYLHLLDMATHEYLGLLWAYMTGKIDKWPI